jgi:chorismate dehydratase
VKLGYIDYLNCYPFYYHMFEKEPVPGIEILPAYPSSLNSMLSEGSLDMSVISSGALGDIEEPLCLLPDFCLSSVGYVHSVLLKSRLPIEELHGRNVGITRASRTSDVLLKILLERYYHLQPVYSLTEPNPTLNGIDAALLIGNEAMMANKQLAPFTYDLGELWFRKTGFPVVFAVFAVREKVIKQYNREITSIIKSYNSSLSCLTEEENTVVHAACNRYPHIVYDIKSYYHLFKFNFTDSLKEALQFYLDSATDLGIFKRSIELKYLDLVAKG